MSHVETGIPEMKLGGFEIKRVPSEDVFGGDGDKNHTVLYKRGVEAIMQDTILEYREHKYLWDNAHGDVLIGGLGIGFVNQKLLDNKKVTSVTIVEKYQEVIDMVWDYCPKNETFKLIHEDIEEWEPSSKYNIGWFDTWLTDNKMTHEEYINYMTNKYKKSCKKIGFWKPL